jgi:glycosyl transferase family 87
VDRRAALADAALYAASALFAGLAAAFASIPLYREWGRIAVAPYAAGAMTAIFLSLRGASVRARAILAIAVLIGAALLPLGLEVAWRARTAPGLHAQSEAIITEEAANALLDGRSPYAATYVDGPLAARPVGTKTHFPYLPAMLVFGMPRAAGGHHPWTDARVAFAGATLGLAGLALRRWNTAGGTKLRAFQVLAVLPTGALLMATGGDDLPVLALLLVALVLAAEGSIIPAGIALGLALATKQTAWVLVPFIGAAAVLRFGRRAALTFAAAAAAVALPVIAAFVAWNPNAFWEDVVRFPLGLGQASTAAATPTPGSALVDAFPDQRVPLTLVLIGMVAVAAIALLIRWPPSTVGGAAVRAAAIASLAIVAAPAARTGYVVYPVDLAVWGWLLTGTTRALLDPHVGRLGLKPST